MLLFRKSNSKINERSWDLNEGRGRGTSQNRGIKSKNETTGKIFAYN